MARPNYLTGEDTEEEEDVIGDDDSEDSAHEFLLESGGDNDDDDDGSDDNDAEIDGEKELFVSKDGIVWNARPISVHSAKHQTKTMTKSFYPGVTNDAESCVDNIKDAFMLFFPPPIEKLILKHTNAHIKARKLGPIIPIDANLLYAYIGVLILAGVHR